MASKKTTKITQPHMYRPMPCPSCNPSTKHECDTCNGTGVFGGSPEHKNCRFPGCDNPIPPGDDFEPDVCAQHRTAELNNQFDDLHSDGNSMEEAAEILVTAITEDNQDCDIAFRSLMVEKTKAAISNRVSLEELYLDSSDHPEVKELIRQGFRLKKSRGDRDVLEGPGGERRVIKRKNGKVHVVREADEAGDGKVPCDHCDENGYSQKYKATARKANSVVGDISGGSTAYYDEKSEAASRRATKRKEGIMRAVRKLTKEEQELFENPFLTPAKLHKYISFGREDLFNAERSKRDDLNRAIRHEDEAGEAKTDDDRNFHNDRAKKFSASAAMTDKAIALRKKGLSTAAKRLLKTGGAPK